MNVCFCVNFFILLLGFNVRAQSITSSSYSSAGVINIVNGKIDCGGIKCPENSYSCELNQRSSADGKTLTTSKICKDQTGNVLAKNETSQLSQNNEPYSANSYMDIEGVSRSIVNGSPLSPEEAKALTEGIVKRTSEMVDEMTRSIQNQIDAMQNNMNNLMKGIFGR